MHRRTLSALAVTVSLLALASSASAAPPSNDNFEQPAALDGETTGTVDEATRQPGEPAHGAQTVWYAYRPAAAERVAVASKKTSSTLWITVYTGPSLTALREVGTSQDTGALRVAFDAAVGETYWIAVAVPYETTASSFELAVLPAPLPHNDDFEAATKVSVPGRYTGSLADATGELGEPDHQGNTPRHSVWYRFRAPRTGRLSIESSGACGSNVAVYTGTDLARLRPVKASGGSIVRFRARKGRTYRVAVNCSGDTLGDYELTISDGSIKGKGVELALTGGQTVQSIRTRGLRTTVTTRREVAVGIELLVGPATARRLGLKSRVLGRTRGRLDYAQQLPAVIRLSGEAKRALSGVESLSAIVRLTLLNTGAPNRVLTVPVELPN